MRPDTLNVLEQILTAVQNVANDTAGMALEEFERDRRTRQLVERNFEIIGEAVNRLRIHDPSVAVRISSHNQIVAFRNALVHGYDRIDYQKVWQTAQESLPILRAEVEQLLREAGERVE